MPEISSDKRLGIKIGNYIVVITGTIVGLYGLIFIIVEMSNGKSKKDEA